ncbi:MAG: phage portal protein, partial [Planctomycetota bacterium]
AVRQKANIEVSAFKFWRRFMIHALLWNNAYGWISRNGNGQAVELYNLLPDRTWVERIDGQLFVKTLVGNNQQEKTYHASDILHVDGLCINNVSGADLVSHARNAWALGLAQEKFVSKFFSNGARVGGILEIPANYKKTTADKLEEGFTNKYSGTDNLLKTVILRDGAKFHKTMFSPDEAQSSDISDKAVAQVARHFGLPPSKLGLPDHSSYNSKAEDNRNYIDSTLAVWMAAIVAECNCKLLSEGQQRSGSHYFEHDTSALLKLDPLSQAQTYEIYMRSETLLPDEVRRYLNLGPRPDGGGAKVATVAGAPAKDEPDHEVTRFRYAVGARGRHKSKNPAAFLEWVDSALASHRDEYRETFGGEATLLDPLLEDLRQIVETTGQDELAAAVDERLTNFEIAG